MNRPFLPLIALLLSTTPVLAQPTITQQPTNQVVASGGTITLSVTASGEPLRYQWFKDSRRLLGATNSAMIVTNADILNSGTYFVVVTNGDGMVISLPASVAVGNSSLLAWGFNNHGQLGNGTTSNTNWPISVASNVVAGAAGGGHTLFVTADGTLWAMGYNAYGQLGNGTTSSTNWPVSVASNVVAVAAGTSHSLFVKTDGTLWAMGQNASGQLGNGTLNDTNTPVIVASNVVAVAAGTYHSLFVKTDGTLWAMGDNNYGQLGNGTSFNNYNLPISVASDVVAVAGGERHSLFVKSDGTLWAMGSNQHGQLGNGTSFNNYNLPISVASNVVAVAAGTYHSLFVKTDGTLWAMGDNTFGQLGNGRNSGSVNLTPISVASNVVAVAAGFGHSLFVTTDGTPRAMGFNVYGQLGGGTTSKTNLPVNLPYLFVANIFPADAASHSLAIGNIRSPATVTLGNLNQIYTGNAINVTASTTPPGLTVNLTYNGSSVAPTNPGSYTVVGTIGDPNYCGSDTQTLVISWPTAGPTNQVVTVGGTVTLGMTVGGPPPAAYQWFKDSRLILGATNSTLTLTNAATTDSGTYYVVVTDGSAMAISLPALVAVGNPALLACGDNQYGQLGTDTATSTILPITVASNVVAGAGGRYHSLFVTADGTLWAMGLNGSGQLGNGQTSGSPNPTPISVASNVLAVAAGYYHSLFVTADGTLWAMGNNQYGQLGNSVNAGTQNPNSTPISVASNVVAVAAGYNHSLFLTADGTLWVMGSNQYGQLGNGTTSNNNLPVIVANHVVAVAGGERHSLFVKADGTLWGIGYNGDGQLGNGTTSNTNLPISVASNVVAVAAGSGHSLFVKTDGTLWAMGFNINGQLGNGTMSSSTLPVNVASNVLAVAAGAYHSLFVKDDGTLWVMGWNVYGQLGNGAVGHSSLPMNVLHLSVANIFPADPAFYSLALGVNYNATVTFSNLTQICTGCAINVTVGTVPPSLTVNLTYNGSPFAPTNPGSYIVIGTISDLNYYGSATNNLIIGLPPQSFTSQLGGSGLQLQLAGTPNYPYILQMATNLTPPVNWQSILTNPADVNSHWSFTITNLSGIPARYYRAAAGP